MKNRNLHKRLENNKGAAFVEFALSILAFLTMIFSVIDVVKYGYFSVISEFAVNTAIREIILDKGFSTSADDPTTIDALLRNKVATTAGKYGLRIDPNDPNVKIGLTSTNVNISTPGATTLNANNCTNTIAPGRARDLISLCLKFDLRIFLGTVTATIDSFAIARNEPYV